MCEQTSAEQSNQTAQDLLRIKQKLEEKNIELNEPVSIEVFQKIEEEHGIVLPSELVQFYTQISNGLTLDSGEKLHGIEYIKKWYFDANAGTIGLKFPFSEPWVWEDEDEEPSDALMETIHHGNIALVCDGCEQSWCLVVTGEEQGQMWFFTDVGIQPCSPKQNFLSWLEIWLDRNGDYFQEIGRMVEGSLMQNIQSYHREEYTTNTERYTFVEEGIYLFKMVYDSVYTRKDGFVMYVYYGGDYETSEIKPDRYVTTLSFEQENRKGPGYCPKYPLYDIEWKFGVGGSDIRYRDTLPENDTCYIELSSTDIEEVRSVRKGIIGKKAYNVKRLEDGDVYIDLVIE